ncbi:MAG: VWA domain-containing protein [Bryobacteraceae bacterium]
MSFDRWWMLLFVPLPLAWWAWEARRTGRRLGLALKALSLVAIVLALAEPQLDVWETKVAVAVLADTSASVSGADLEKASTLVGQLEGARGRHWMRVFPFAGALRDLAPAELAGKVRLQLTSGDSGKATDLEAAIRDAIGSAPAGMAPRVVLISDGRENRGSVLRAAWQARQLGVPVDTYALAGRPRPALRLEQVSLPPVVFSGERFAIEMVVSAPRPGQAEVDLAAEGKPLGSSKVDLQAGENTLRVQANIGAVGAVELSGRVRSATEGEVAFARAITLRKPRMLMLSQDPPGTGVNLSRVLEAAQFEVNEASIMPAAGLDQYQVIVFNNWDLEALPGATKADLEAYVQQGGGLLVIGGERNVYVENKEAENALDRALPAKLAPPRSPEGTLVVLIVDKSSSMEGKKMELARLAAIGVVENLRPIDMVGVLIFDNSFQWAVPIRKAEDRVLIKRLIAGITPDGGTQIAPALTEAYRRTVPVQATFKHVVLLTDGISEEGDSIALAKEASTQKVTISTVGLGQDVNRAYLEKIASFAKGKSYFLSDPSGLEQILLRDVMEHTGSTAIEKPLAPKVAKQAEILDGVGIETAPALKGYVRFQSKPSADVLLTMDEKDPLLARWQYGLGRSAIFASDAKARWATDWVSWNGYDRFWTNVVRDLLPHTQPVEATLRFDSGSSELVADYRLSRHVREPDRLPAIFAIGPDNFRRPIAMKKVAPGTYRGVAPVGGRRGLFRVRPLEDSRAFPELGAYLPEQELETYGADTDLLRQVSAYTRGRFEPAMRQVFDSGGKAIPSRMSLWPGLLGLAVLLNITELLSRKWKGILELFGGAAA